MLNNLLKLIEAHPRFLEYSVRCDSKAGVDYSIACQEWEKKLNTLEFKKYLNENLSLRLALKSLLSFFGDGSTDNEWEDADGNSIEQLLSDARLLVESQSVKEVVSIDDFSRNASVLVGKALSGIDIQVIDENKKVVLNLNRG